MNMPPKYGMKTSRIRQFWGKSRQYEQNSDCYETRALPLPKKRGREMPAPILGSNGLGETWSAFGTLALVRGDEESEPEAIEGD
jgi:hypothetical protein